MKKIYRKAVRFISKLRNLVADEFKKSPSPSATIKDVQPPKRKSASAATSLADIEGALTRIAKKNGNVLAGQVEVLRFEKIKEEMGDAWEKKRSRMGYIIQRAASKYLGKDDLIRPFGECAHFVVFASISEDEAAAKCALIRDEVEKAFSLDHDLAGKIEIGTAVVSLDGSVVLQDVGTLGEIFERLNQRREKTAANQAENASQKTNQTLDRAARFNVGPDRVKSVNDEFWTTWELDTVDFESIKETLEPVRIAYRPIWDVEKQRLEAFASLPITGVEPRLNYEDDVMEDNPKGGTALLLDIMGIDITQSYLNDPSAGNERLGCSVHYESIAGTNYRKQILAAGSAIKATAKQRFIVELFGFPDQVIAPTVVETVRSVVPFAGTIAVRCDLNWPVFSGFYAAGVRWVGFSSEEFVHGEASDIDSITTFVKKANVAGLHVYTRDLPSENHVLAAVAAGVRYVYGRPMVATPQLPTEAKNFSTNSLISVKK